MANRKKVDLYTSGHRTDTIDVRISNRIIELFSEGLYKSPTKAVEELVSNAFDAGAHNVHVALSKKLNVSGSSIAVIDDGMGMGPADLKRHWFVGASNKRDRKYAAPLGRAPIGKFGIGKLATYVLAERLTHVTRQGSSFYAVTMNYADIPGGDELLPEKNETDRVKLPLRTLTESDAKEMLKPWNDGTIKLFGPGAAKNWTCAIMTVLRPMAGDLRIGRLRWVLATAMPLRDDFAIFLDGESITPSKEKGRLQRWVLGKEVKRLPHVPLTVTVDKSVSASSLDHYGLKNDEVGDVHGYFEIYNDLLTTGKSKDIERSYGFFVYVNGRLINVDDEYFGIDSNLLKHGAFARFRMVAHINSLDDELRSTREDVREGTPYSTARRILQDCFNIARVELEHRSERDSGGPALSERFSATSATLTAQPIVALVAKAMKGDARPRLTRYPTNLSGKRRDDFLADLESRIGETTFFREVKLEELAYERGICEYDAESGNLVINASHPICCEFLGRLW